MTDPEYERDRAEMLVSRAAIVLDSLLTLWNWPATDIERLGNGYSASPDPDDPEWYVRYKDEDMEIRLQCDSLGEPRVRVNIKGYKDIDAGEDYSYDDTQMNLCVHDAFWQIYKEVHGI